MTTVMKRGGRVEYKQMADNIVDVQGGSIHLLGTTKFYLHFHGHVRLIEVAVTEGVAKEDEMVLSLHTLKRLGIVQDGEMTE